ncbi:MAG: YbaK/EbsC family protein [Calditrichaeota bacterium]|nr:YbaK/EbsC family protein [Calditrichota bacterium]
MKPLPEGAQRVQDALMSAGSVLIVELMPDSTSTAAEAAAAVGVTIAQIGKSIVFIQGEVPVVAVVPGDRQVDLALLTDCVSGAGLKRPDADRVFQTTEFRIGGVSPFGLPKGAKVVIDRSLQSHPYLYVAAGYPRAVVRVTYAELLELSHGFEADISK